MATINHLVKALEKDFGSSTAQNAFNFSVLTEASSELAKSGALRYGDEYTVAGLCAYLTVMEPDINHTRLKQYLLGYFGGSDTEELPPLYESKR